MSVMRCDGCDNFIDTDFSVEGVWENVSPFRFWCASCSEDSTNLAMVAALKEQDPQMYADLMEREQ